MLVTWHYRIRKNLMERFDPRARWIFSLTFLVSATVFWDARILAGFFTLAFIWYSIARVRWQDIRKGWYLVIFLLTTMIVVNTIVTGGGAGGVVPPGGHLIWPDPIVFPLTDWKIHIGLTVERVWFALCQVLRIGGISAIFLILPYSMNPRLYGVTFKGLGLSDKFAYSMELAFRYVPTLAREFSTTLDAQRARGYEIERVKGGIFKQIIRIAPLIVPVTMNSILIGEDVTNAMDLRCFGQYKRTWLNELKYTRIDYVLIGFSALMLITSFIVLYAFHFGGFWVPGFFLHWFGK